VKLMSWTSDVSGSIVGRAKKFILCFVQTIHIVFGGASSLVFGVCKVLFSLV